MPSPRHLTKGSAYLTPSHLDSAPRTEQFGNHGLFSIIQTFA